MKSGRLWMLVAIILAGSVSVLAQVSPSTENGVKSFGSYQAGDFDTVNLQTGNVMFHVPLFSYPQRGKLPWRFVLTGSSKNWQVGEWVDQQQISHLKWILGEPAGVYVREPDGLEFHRNRFIATDFTGNQTETDGNYSLISSDGAVHWLSGMTPNGNMITQDGSGIQFTLIRGTQWDHSDDSGVIIERDGTQTVLPSISLPIPVGGQGNNLIGMFFPPERVLDGWGTTQVGYDVTNGALLPVDANGNSMSVSTGILTDTLGRNASGSSTPTSDYSGCVTSRPITEASIFSFPGPNGSVSTMKMCVTSFIPSAAFSQPNVAPPSTPPSAALRELDSFLQGYGFYLGSVVMPDGNHWSFDYDAFGNVTGITLPTGGTITYQWTEIPHTCGDGSSTRVSRAVSVRTVTDNNGHSYPWSYTWGTLQQDGSITNYVVDPNGNETAHVFRPVTQWPCGFYETQTRDYQGTHTSGTLLKTVDMHYVGRVVSTTSSSFAADVVPDTITTTLPGNKVSKVVRQYDSGYSYVITFGKVINEKVYDFGSGAPGSLLRETVTTYQWQANSAYLNAGFLDLPASVVVKDGAGCALAETDYTYDEANYLTAYTGTLPTGTHGVAPGGTIRGNLTTVTKWLAPTSSCNPKGGTAITSHTKWYDTGVPYQTVDPMGHTTTLSYDPAYAGAYVTQTCSPQTGSVAHCASGTYDFVTGLLESLTNENATTQASGNTPGDAAHTSNYAYDTAWRMTTAQAPPDPANNNARAQTSFTYSTANTFPLNLLRQRSVTTALTDLSTIYVDGLARTTKATHSLPDGTATALTTYDGVGQTTSVTNPYFTTADPTYGVTSSLYDGLGRGTQVTKQDGSIIAVQYNVQPAQIATADCTKSTDEAGKQRVACSDGLGRLIEVDEPNPAAPAVAAQSTVTINGSLLSHTTSGSPSVKSSLTVSVGSWDGSGGDMHVDDPSEPCPPLPQTCPQIYDSGWLRLTVNGVASQVSYNSSSTDGSLASALASSNAYVTASADGNHTNLQANNAGVAGNSISVVTAHATNDPGDFGGGGFSFDVQSAHLAGGADAVNPVTTYDQGTVTLTIGSFTASAPYGQSTNSTAAQVASALAGSGPAGLNRAGSPVSAAVNGASITITYATAGTVGNGVVVSSSSQSTQTQWAFSPPSFTSAGTTLANGLNAGDVRSNPFVTLYSYDGLGNLLCVEQHGGVTGTGCSAAPSADATSPWRVRRFSYDSLGRLLTAKNPESGTISYTYDADGEMLQKVSPQANQLGTAITTISYCYDELHRMKGKAYSSQSCPLTSPVATFSYDSGANAKGKLTALTDQAGSGSYTFDILGRMSSEQRTIAGVSKTMSYDYNLDGSIQAVHYPSNAVVTYTPDSAGRALSAVDSGNGVNYATGATYLPDGPITGFINGNNAGFAGITNTFSYNKRLQPVNMSASSPSQTVFSLGYDFHVGNGATGSDNGNVWGITNYKDSSRSQSFTYDPLNRLTSAQNTGTDCAQTVIGGKTKFWGNAYGYDAWGNLLSKTVTKCGAENLGLSADAHNQIHSTSGADYQFDAAGNMTFNVTPPAATYTYDQENRITGAGGFAYTYDGDGNRVKKTDGTTGTLYWYMALGIVGESDLTGTMKSEYVFFGGERVARRDLVAPTGVFYYFSDHLKTTDIVTDAQGNIRNESDFYPWGGELQFLANDSNHYKFTGKERDDETQLDYFGARYYSNGLGRFISADWATAPESVPYADFLNPQTVNLYRYPSNPETYADKDGHQSSLDAQRQAAVRQAWQQERARVAAGDPGTVNWTAAQKTELLQRGRVGGFEGHHINSVNGSPQLASNPDNIKFVEGRAGNLAEHGGNFRTPTSGPLLSRAFVALQVIQVFTSTFSTYMDEKRSGVQTGPFWNPNQLTIADPAKAANVLNGTTIYLGDGTQYNPVDVKDGKYYKHGCESDCAIDSNKMKDQKFTLKYSGSA